MIHLLYFFSLSFYLTLLILTLKKDKKSDINKSFSLILLGLFLWTATLYIYFYIDVKEQLLFWGRSNYAAAVPFTIGLAGFFYYFPKKSFEIKKFIKNICIFETVVIFVISLFTDLVDKNEVMTENGPVVTLGRGYLAYIIHFLFYSGLSVFFAIQKMFTLKGLERTKFQYSFWIFIPTIILLVVSNGILPMFNILSHLEYSFLFVLPLSICCFYSVSKYRFLNLKFVVSQGIKKGISFVLSFGLVYGLCSIIEIFITPDLLIKNLLMLIFGIRLYNDLLRFCNSDRFNRFFGVTSTEYFRQVVLELKNKEIVYKNMSELKADLKITFSKNLLIKSTKIILLNDKTRKNYPELINHYNENHEILINKEVQFFKQERNLKYAAELNSLGEVCVPLFRASKNLIGFFVLGKKFFDDDYFAQEIRELEKIQSFLSLKIIGILYSQHLQQEVDTKTKELQITNRELSQSYEKLKELDKMKDEFLSIASHELRTPMAVIKGYTDFLLAGDFGALEATQKKPIKKIFDTANTLIQLVNKMLDISRLEAGKMDFSFQKISITKFIEEIVEEFRLICTQKKLTLTFLNPEDLSFMIETDPEKLKQIFMNLLGNAHKFTTEGGNITIILEKIPRKKSHFQVSIIDTGVGIPQAEQTTIFEKFHQSQNYLQKSYTGTGLGLSIVKKILEIFGGEIWVTSKTNEGACFTFTLPFKSTQPS